MDTLQAQTVETRATKAYNVAIVGATGLVGQEILRCLQSRSFPLARLRLMASPRSAGTRMAFGSEEIIVEEATPEAFRRVDLAFFAAAPEVTAHLASTVTKNGTLVIDIANAFPTNEAIPIVVPEVNPQDLKKQTRIVVSPSSGAIQLAVALFPLHRINPIRRLVVTMLESVSGSGTLAMEELSIQSRTVLDGRTVIPHVYSHQIAFNLLPEVDVFLDSGYSREEWRITQEVRRLLHAPTLGMSVTAVRVPVYYGYAAVVNAEFSRHISVEDARAVLAASPGVQVLDDPSVSLYPQPWVATGKDSVQVGRIREDESHQHTLAMWIVTDNIRKGAALNAVQIAELLIERGYLATEAAGAA